MDPVAFFETLLQLKYLVRERKSYKFLYIKRIKDVPSLDIKKCDLCEKCVLSCPSKALSMDNGVLDFDVSRCINCFLCIKICPTKAIEQVTVDKVSFKSKNLLKEYSKKIFLKRRRDDNQN